MFVQITKSEKHSFKTEHFQLCWLQLSMCGCWTSNILTFTLWCRVERRESLRVFRPRSVWSTLRLSRCRGADPSAMDQAFRVEVCQGYSCRRSLTRCLSSFQASDCGLETANCRLGRAKLMADEAYPDAWTLKQPDSRPRSSGAV